MKPERSLALASCFVAQGRVVERRAADDRGEEGALGGGQLRDVLVEVGLRRGLDAVRAAAVVDGVEVVLEDLVLGLLLVDLERDEDLAGLARQRAVGGEEVVLDVLLGDRRAALGRLAALDRHPDRPRDAGRRDAVVLVEVLVLRREHRLLHVVGHLRRAAPTRGCPRRRTAAPSRSCRRSSRRSTPAPSRARSASGCRCARRRCRRRAAPGLRARAPSTGRAGPTSGRASGPASPRSGRCRTPRSGTAGADRGGTGGLGLLGFGAGGWRAWSHAASGGRERGACRGVRTGLGRTNPTFSMAVNLGES